MKLHSLTPASGSVKSDKRIGRGQGSGRGGTSTKGHKGDKSRAGHKLKRHFEGGQMPLQMRIPKVGFKNVNRVEYVPFNLETLQEIAEKYNVSSISPAWLKEQGMVKRTDLVKILGRGEVSTKLEVTAHKFSEAAKAAIEQAGGTANTI